MNATPRDLDPKFKDATVPQDEQDRTPEKEEDRTPEKDETPREAIARLSNSEVPNDPHEGMITSFETFVDSAGNTGQKQHGPMPRSEWAEYSRKNGL